MEKRLEIGNIMIPMVPLKNNGTLDLSEGKIK